MCRVFVVDDNPDQVELVTHVLRSRGDDVEGYCNPFLALTAAIENPPDVILVDQVMPFIEGTQLIKEMKKAGVLAKFIVLSALSDISELPALRKGIADKYLSKLIHNDTLYQEVHAVL